MAKKKGVQPDNGANLHTVLILDGSSSMSHLRHQTIESVNEYLSGIKDDVAKVTLAVFRSDGQGVDIKTKTFEDIADGVKIGPEDYQCGGMTPLHDAIGTTVDGLTDENALIVIVTDGHENCSQEYDQDKIQQLIKQKTKDGYKFIYLGADQDAWAGGAAVGVDVGSSYNFVKTRAGIRGMGQSLSHDTVAYAATFTGDGGANWDGTSLKATDDKIRGVDIDVDADNITVTTTSNDGTVVAGGDEDDN